MNLSELMNLIITHPEPIAVALVTVVTGFGAELRKWIDWRSKR